jgi:hypothetical protein
MDYNQLIDGLKSAGHDVSAYAPPTVPPKKKSPTAASALASMSVEAFAAAISDEIVNPLLSRIETLEARVKELEARSQTPAAKPVLRAVGK